MRKKNNSKGFGYLVAWRILILSAIAPLSLSISALAVPNNGFDTDYIYCRTNDKQDQWPRYHGSIRVFNEVTGQHIKLIQPQGADWSSLTFSGTGNDDARLFVAKQVDLDTNDLYEDILVAELDNTCEVTDPYDPSQCPPTHTVYLSALLGASPGDDVVVGWGSLRYSMYHNSLFLGVNPNRDANPYSATIYEVNLALDTVLNTYTAGNITEETGVALDINGHNGDVYVTNRTLLSASGALVKVDTVDPDKGAVTTLIDGSRLAGEWIDHGPKFVVYRNNNNLEAAQTVLVVFYDTGGGTAGEFVVEEYYLEQTDGNGDLLKRQDAYNGRRGAGAGQLDEYSGSVFTTRWWPANPAGNAGADEYKADDVHYRAPFDAALNNILYNNGFFDVDSPGFLNINVLPISEQTSLAYTGQPADPSSIKYVVINKGYAFSGNVNYSVVESPEVGWLSLSKTGG
ncbi:MAG: hypothetical protein JSV03_00820, partial [Planctomycetota bacterium]